MLIKLILFQGKTWTKPVSIEGPNVTLDTACKSQCACCSTICGLNLTTIDTAVDGTLAPYTNFGRLYAMYNMNTDNITRLPSGQKTTRTDEIGHFVMKYSDNSGRSWSKERYEVPFRLTPLDKFNTWGGKVKEMWSVDQVYKLYAFLWHQACAHNELLR